HHDDLHDVRGAHDDARDDVHDVHDGQHPQFQILEQPQKKEGEEDDQSHVHDDRGDDDDHHRLTSCPREDHRWPTQHQPLLYLICLRAVVEIVAEKCSLVEEQMVSSWMNLKVFPIAIGLLRC
ncbi:hypothetical protein WICPIJ_002507, partial [Wickerhamomyces pijperi]